MTTSLKLSNSRTGATLVEVLVAIFVMGIGLLALLVLFPLGALNMAQAIRSDRTAHIAANAAAIARFRGIRDSTNWVDSGGVAYVAPTVYPAGYTGPAYPVYVDPFPIVWSLPGAGWVGGGSSGPGIQRCTVNYVGTTNFAALNRWFGFRDDAPFQENGLVQVDSNIQFQRENRYSWAYLCRREDYAATNPGVDLKVVVYERRPLTVLGETVYSAVYTAGSNVITLTPAPTNVRKGTWILDATPADTDANVRMHGHFYRVASVDGSTVELEQNVRDPTYLDTNTSVTGVAVVMDNVVEVFERGTND